MTDDKNGKSEETNPFEWASLPKAKRHNLLANISNRMKGCHQTGTYEVFGTWYTLRTIDPAESTWTLRFIQGADYFSAAKSTRGPTVAAAITAIGAAEDEMVPVTELFEIPDEMEEGTKKLLEKNADFQRDWRNAEILRWLSEPDQHEDTIKVLYDRYLSLNNERQEALKALSPLSKKTPTGASSATSSPEKESSSPTPASPE